MRRGGGCSDGGENFAGVSCTGGSRRLEQSAGRIARNWLRRWRMDLYRSHRINRFPRIPPSRHELGLGSEFQSLPGKNAMPYEDDKDKAAGSEVELDHKAEVEKESKDAE